MLEENTTYSYEEMSAYLGTRNNQGIERKLRNYGVEFTRTRRGATAQYTIKHLADPFKLCAVFDLGFPCNTDIDKLTEYTYYLINDDEFYFAYDLYLLGIVFQGVADIAHTEHAVVGKQRMDW